MQVIEKKMKDALPRTPTKRAALISSYIHIKRASISPTVATLQKLQILTSNEQREMSAMGSSIIKDMKIAQQSLVKCLPTSKIF